MFGSYRISHSLSYLADNFNKHNGMNISVNAHLLVGMKILTTKIQSRHRAKKEYRVYISYLSTTVLEINKYESIQGY